MLQVKITKTHNFGIILESDIIGMIETWIEKKRQSRLKEPENFNRECQHAKREKKGRAMKGIITGIKKNIREENEEEVTRTELEGIQPKPTKKIF